MSWISRLCNCTSFSCSPVVIIDESSSKSDHDSNSETSPVQPKPEKEQASLEPTVTRVHTCSPSHLPVPNRYLLSPATTDMPSLSLAGHHVTHLGSATGAPQPSPRKSPRPRSVQRPTSASRPLKSNCSMLEDTTLAKHSRMISQVMLNASQIYIQGTLRYVDEDFSEGSSTVSTLRTLVDPLYKFLIDQLSQEKLSRQDTIIMIVDKSFHIFAMSENGFKMLGYEYKDLLGRKVESVPSLDSGDLKMSAANEFVQASLGCADPTTPNEMTPLLLPVKVYRLPFERYTVLLAQKDETPVIKPELDLTPFHSAVANPPLEAPLNQIGVMQETKQIKKVQTQVRISYLKSEAISLGTAGVFKKTLVLLTDASCHEQAFLLCRKDFTILGMNHLAETMLRYEPIELLARNISFLTNEDGMHQLQIEKAKQNGKGSSVLPAKLTMCMKSIGTIAAAANDEREKFVAEATLSFPRGKDSDYFVVHIKEPYKHPIEVIQGGGIKISCFKPEYSTMEKADFKTIIAQLSYPKWHLPGSAFLICNGSFSILAMNGVAESLLKCEASELMLKDISYLFSMDGKEKLEKQFTTAGAGMLSCRMMISPKDVGAATGRNKFDADIFLFYPLMTNKEYVVITINPL